MTAEEAVALLRGAVAIASPSGEERAVSEYLVAAMETFCAEAYLDDVGNAVGRWGHGDLNVWLLGHVDTVHGRIDVRLEDGALHGRGTVDAKGSFCTFVAAVAGLDRALADRITITLIGAVGEEAPLSVGARHAVATLPRPDAVIIGEPSGWDGITLGYKGSVQLEVTATEASRHTAVDAPIAPEVLVAAYTGIRSWVTESTMATGAGGSPFERLQLRLLQFDTADDGLTRGASMLLGFRLPPGVTATQVVQRCEAEVAAAAREAAANEAAVAVRCTVLPGSVDAYRGDKTGALPGALRAAIRSAGGTPRHKVKSGTADMNVAAAAWRAAGTEVPPMVAYGPGDASLDHTPEEHIEVAEYLRAIAVLADALVALAGHGRSETP